MVTFKERMMSRSSIYSRTAARSRTPLTLNRMTTRPRTAPVTRRIGTSASLYRRASLTARPDTLMTARPGISMTARPGISSVIPAASGSGGLPGGGLTGGVTDTLGSSLSGIGSNISSTFGGVVDQAKSFIPTAVKIIAVVVILKIVLWLVKGRRR